MKDSDSKECNFKKLSKKDIETFGNEMFGFANDFDIDTRGTRTLQRGIKNLEENKKITKEQKKAINFEYRYLKPYVKFDCEE